MHHDTSPPLRSLPASHTPGKAHPARPVPSGPSGFSNTSAHNTSGPKSLSSLAPTAGTNFDGIGDSTPNTCNCAPPDNELAAGPTQLVELVNTELAVYSKTGGTLISAEATNTLFSGFGGGCQSNNDGDGTVLFDTLSQRWVIQQFSVSTTPYLDCVAVSTSSDATGSYNRYSFQYSNFPDYPKMGVWSDAYYASFNMFQGNSFVGAEMCAFDRAAMLAGTAASQQCLTPSSGAPQTSVLPATLDGTTAPPSGEPEWFLGISPSQANALAYWKFHVDWGTPANSTLTGPTNLAVSAFSEACGGGTCIPQSGTKTKLDSLADRLMYRLAYRNFPGDHEAMVVSHAVTSGTSVGMRWYELRPTAGSLTVFQQGTYAPPDSTYRWMGSIAMDHSGDMGLGYSTSSSSLHPGVAYTGRLPGDASGTMEAETTMFTGAGSQTGRLSRWGDYSEMSVDPADDCTFWYVNEYEPANGSFNWHTRIGSLKFSSCGGSAATVTTGSASSVGSSTATIAGSVNPNGLSTTYHFDYGTSTNYSSQAPGPPDPSAGSGTTSQNESTSLTGLSPATTYHYRLEATSSAGTTYGSDQTFTTTSAITVSSAPQGSWVGTYGVNGYDLAAWNGGSDVVSMPGVSASLSQGSRYVWAANTSDPRALENAAGTSRTAATYYSSSAIQVQLSFSSSYIGNLELYAVDFDSLGRRETITVGSQTANLTSDFSQGAWVTLPISVAAGGTLTITVTNTGPANAVLSGIFLN